ncbi:hypothetical protein [Spirillospora sp. NPDC029432]|uniref:hypothetical protein n=1 Tax=Spirillospora sp. NPDC029432 TaxID=3154599 RepID=UPI0034569527
MSGAIAIFLLTGLLGLGHHHLWWTPDAPRDPDALVLRFHFVPGMARSPAHLPAPQISLYGDGRLITTKTDLSQRPPRGVTRDQYLTRAAYERFHRDARVAGLATAREHDPDEQVLDGGSTVVTLLAGGRHRTTKISAGAGGPRVHLIDRLADRLRAVPREDLTRPTATYRPERIAAVTTRVSHPDGQVRPWPLSPLKEPCTLLTGQDAQRIAEVSTPPYTTWQSGPHHYSIFIRPLLPDEKTCPGRASP